ncbi:MAG: SDR family oxidoreductase [Pseudomonadota bacterium]
MQPNVPSKTMTGVLIGGSGLIGGTIAHYFKKAALGPCPKKIISPCGTIANYVETPSSHSIELLTPSRKELSLRNAIDIRNYLQQVRPAFIINTAIASIDSSAQLAFETNYLGTLNLARAAAVLHIPYIHISSAALLPSGENLTEEDQLPLTADMSNYAKSKLMAEQTLRCMHQTIGLDYTCIRLAVVYGAHDHKIQGFHRLLFSITDGAMPVLFTKKKVMHSYSNATKLPYFIHHILMNRREFSGETYHFVDKEPVELASLILTIKSYLKLKVPRELYVSYPLAVLGKKVLEFVLKGLSKIGLKANLPAELMFLDSFYKTQTLSSNKLHQSSFCDPFPDETLCTKLSALLIYYLIRWSQQNLIATFSEFTSHANTIDSDFQNDPQTLLDSIHQDSLGSPSQVWR